jgi:hypothetical protein
MSQQHDPWTYQEPPDMTGAPTSAEPTYSEPAPGIDNGHQHPTPPAPERSGRPRWAVIAAVIAAAVALMAVLLTITGGRPDATTALREQVADDADVITEIPEGTWVAQLSSHRIRPGFASDAAEILADHERIRTTYPSARLLWSGDVATFERRDFYVTIEPTSYETPTEANHWCDVHGLAPQHCFAKRIGQTNYITTIAPR